MSLVKVQRSATSTRYCEEPYGQWAHATLIRRGDLYVRLATPPREAGPSVDPFEIEGWHITIMCVECALSGDDWTVIKVIGALYARGVLERYNPPPGLVLRAGIQAGRRVAAQA